ncbi:chlorophyll a/b-binding protein domain-containing protein [Pelagophyceae sp. CCMP2097]|nr:chlorophyll a/b-binding protein domain-containing protein [Pelagophyceae sp. CCMP2097]
MASLRVPLLASLVACAASLVAPRVRAESRRRLTTDDEDALNDARKSVALPWQDRPNGLIELVETGGEYVYSLTAGDFGFDPLGWSEVGWGLNAGETADERLDRVYAYREAELKHGRLAMLAAVGWPISELYDGALSQRFGLQSDLVNPDATGIGLAPSLLNGGLGKVSIAWWLVVGAGAAIVEAVGKGRMVEAARVSTSRIPGDLGFDPFGLYPSDEDDQSLSFKEAGMAFDLASKLEARAFILKQGTAPETIAAEKQDPRVMTVLEKRRKGMIQQELTHGRTAMLAIVGFVVQEFVTKVPVVEETPEFFIPDRGELQAEEEFQEVGQASVDVLVGIFKEQWSEIKDMLDHALHPLL